jgi:hypothetical protein
VSEPEYKERLARGEQTRRLLRSALDKNKLDAVVYPLQKRLVVPVTELNQADRTGILASVTGFPAITASAAEHTRSRRIEVSFHPAKTKLKAPRDSVDDPA